MKRRFLYLLPFIILGAGLLAMLFFSSFKKTPPKKKPEAPFKIVDVQTVHPAPIPAEVTAYGRLKSSQPVVLYSEVTGTLEAGSLAFRPGQSFKKGDLLLKVDTRQIRLDIDTAKSELLTALATLLPEIKVDFPGEYAVWQSYFNSCRFDRPVPELPPAANQKIKLYLSRFSVYKIYFSIRDLEILYEKHFFYAPFDGSIASADLRVGSNVRPGTKLGEIINLEAMEAEMPIPAEDLRWIEEGSPAELTSNELPGTWSGSIRRIGKTIDTRTQTVQIYITLDNGRDDRLYDGIFMKAVIPGRIIPGAVIVPRKALYEQQYVYVLSGGQLDYRRVRIVRREPEYVIADEGLADGDRLVVEMMQGVAPGMPARARDNATAGDGQR